MNINYFVTTADFRRFGGEPSRRETGPYASRKEVFSDPTNKSFKIDRSTGDATMTRGDSFMRIVARPSEGSNPYALHKVGAKAAWRDPAVGDFGRVAMQVAQERRVYEIFGVRTAGTDGCACEDDDIILMSDGYSEIEAPAREVDIIEPAPEI